MSNRVEVWNLHCLATTYHQRPSAIAGIDDEWTAYQFDMAVFRYAQHVESELSRKRPLSAILHEADEAQAAGGYASFAQMGVVRRMKIDPSGIW